MGLPPATPDLGLAEAEAITSEGGTNASDGLDSDFRDALAHVRYSAHSGSYADLSACRNSANCGLMHRGRLAVSPDRSHSGEVSNRRKLIEITYRGRCKDHQGTSVRGRVCGRSLPLQTTSSPTPCCHFDARHDESTPGTKRACGDVCAMSAVEGTSEVKYSVRVFRIVDPSRTCTGLCAVTLVGSLMEAGEWQ
jgi:hypothetical protein